MAKSPYFAPPRAPTTQGAHSMASWVRMLLIYAFIIHIYYSYKHQLHKQFVVTSKKIASV